MKQMNTDQSMIWNHCLHITIGHDGNESYENPSYEYVRW